MFGSRTVLVLAFLLAMGAQPHAQSSQAQGFPSRPMTLVVPFGVGSGSDLIARVLGARMSELLGQTVVIENVSGAGGMTAAARVAHAPPDGYQFVLGSIDTFAINQSLYKKPFYNAATDFSPVGLVTDQALVLIARKDFPADDMKGFMAYAKENHAKLQFASGGVGSASHLTCARINAAIAEPEGSKPHSKGKRHSAVKIPGASTMTFRTTLARALRRLRWSPLRPRSPPRLRPTSPG